MSKKSKKIYSAPKRNFFAKPIAFFVDLWPVLALLTISLLLCFLNFDSGTFLTGWDNLHPEFNSAIYLKRSFFAVWQEYQGTGLLGGMAHAADLPRVLFIYLVSLLNLVPVNFIRYFTTFLPLVLGPIGVYFLLKKIFSHTKLSHKTIQISTFLASLYYLLNLSTLQTFFIPFETFTWFYGSIPFIIYFLIIYYEQPTITKFLRLFLVSFLAGTAFYVETLFIVFLLCLAPFLIEKLTSGKKHLQNLAHTTSSFFAILLPHLYWLFPIIFFVFTNATITTQSRINSISSIETYYRNLEFGNIGSLAYLKSYLFKYLDLGINNKYDYLLSPWLSHLNSPLILVLGAIFFILILLGIYYSFKTKFAWSRSFISIILICYFFLLGGGLLLNSTFPLLGELLRSPFTKFSLPLAFAYTYFFAIGVVFLLDIFSFLDSKLTYNLTLFTIFFLLIIYTSPGFSGNFISKSMRVAIPPQYFELFSYLDTKPADLRIANFPQHTFWGWNYHTWGHRGSGFTWYGIKQPILDRAFDVWEKTSEDYYQELSTALYSQNTEEFDRVINKYNVAYLLIDTSIIAPDTKATTGINYLDRVLATSGQYELEKTFSENLLLYKNKNHTTQNFLDVKPIPEPKTNLLDFSLRPNQNWYEKAGFINTNTTVSSQSLTIPSLSQTEELLPYRIEFAYSGKSLSLRLTPIVPVFFLNQKQQDLAIKPQTINIPVSTQTKKFILELNGNYYAFDLPSELTDFGNYYYLTENYLPTQKSFDLTLYNGIPTEQYPLINSLINSNPTQCYIQKENRKLEKIVSPRSVSLLGTDIVSCLSTPLPPVRSDQLLAISFTYHSPTLLTANVNVSNETFGTTNISQPFEPSNTPKRAQVFTKPSPQNKQVNLILEAEETKTIQEITYKDVYLSSHDPIFEASIKTANIPEKKLELAENNNELQISLPITKTSLDILQTTQSNGLFPEDRNCDQFNKGETVKIVNEDHILYQSRGAIECDYLNLRHLPHSLNYLIGFDVQTTRGLPLTTCLENHSTRRCDVYERLVKTNGIQYLLQPIKNPGEQDGFTLHFFNQSLGKRITENKLKSISIHPFPLNFLQNITTQKSDDTSKNKNEDTNNYEITTTHPAEFLYTAKITCKDNCQESTLNLYQTRSPYWVAYTFSAEYLQLNSLQLTWKIIQNYKTLSSLTTNNSNWYNSWNLPEDSSEVNLVIVYLPQYLQFIGLTILLLTLLISLPLALHHKTKKTS